MNKINSSNINIPNSNFYKQKSKKSELWPECSNIKEFSTSVSNAIRSNSLSFINFKGLNDKLKTTEEINRVLKNEYGIDASFSNYDLASLTLSSVEDFTKYNNKNIFNGLKIGEFEDSNPKNIWMYSSDYKGKSFEIKFNKNLNTDKIREGAKDGYDNCDISSDNEKYQFYNILGRFLCFKQNPYAYTYLDKSNNFSHVLTSSARKIGEYAFNSFSSYNGNYIATKMCKIPTSKQQDRLYEENVGADINFPQAKKQDEIKGTTHSFKSTDEAEDYLKQYGIEAEFDNLIVANLAVSAIEDFININQDKNLFNGLKIEKVIKKDQNNLGSFAYTFSYNENKTIRSAVQFNSTYDWKRHETIAKNNYNYDHYASDNPKYSIYHELGHWLDFHNNPYEYSSTNDRYNEGELYVNNYGKKIYGKIGNYAVKNSLEFKAEYIASRMCGIKFPEAVNKVFNELYTEKNISLVFPS